MSTLERQPATRLHAPERFLIATVVMACLAGLVLSTSTDPDLWGHVAFGRDIVQQRTPRLRDVYSFTSDRPWINHEWLSEVAIYGSYATFGGAGLIALKVLVCGMALLIIVDRIRRYALPIELQGILLALAVVGTKGQTGHVRPQLFSTLLFTVLLSLLATVEGPASQALFALPVIFLFWANLHGGWLVGAGVLAVWTVAQLANKNTRSNRRNVMLTAIACAAATLVNPFGLSLWSFLAETVRVTRADVIDWQPITYSPDILIVWIAIAATCLVAMVRGRRVPPFFPTATLAFLAIGSFRLLRLESFFAIAVAMLLPRLAARRKTDALSRPPLRTLRPSRALSMAVIAVSTVAIVVAAAVIGRNASCVRIGPDGNPEPEAAAFVLEHRLHGRMITWFDWGEYAIWHFGPSIQVSIDGRRETTYTNDIVDAHLAFYRNEQEPGQTIAEKWQSDYVWIPRNLPVISTLRESGWSTIFEGPISAILARRATPAVETPPTMQPRRCFPGP